MPAHRNPPVPVIIIAIIVRSASDRKGDIFSGLNDGILSRAEALAAVDIGKHQNNHPQMATQLKHDVMYHHGMGAPPQRPLQRLHSNEFKSGQF
uniref:Uncharacterized protein n=1 Tax=Anopheles epiroticus TaxID=199890 RepID=A0A182PEA9_9DIPT